MTEEILVRGLQFTFMDKKSKWHYGTWIKIGLSEKKNGNVEISKIKGSVICVTVGFDDSVGEDRRLLKTSTKAGLELRGDYTTETSGNVVIR